jgi:hypothetical protein
MITNIYISICSVVVVGGIITTTLSQRTQERKEEVQEENRNPNGYEYRYRNVLRYHM